MQPPAGFLPADDLQLSYSALDKRRIGAEGEGFEILVDHIRELVGIGDNDLEGLVLAEIIELSEHRVGGLEIKRRLTVGIGKLLRGKDDSAELRVLLVKKVNIAGSADGYIKLLSELDHTLSYIRHLVQTLDRRYPHEYKSDTQRRAEVELTIRTE